MPCAVLFTSEATLLTVALRGVVLTMVNERLPFGPVAQDVFLSVAAVLGLLLWE